MQGTIVHRQVCLEHTGVLVQIVLVSTLVTVNGWAWPWPAGVVTLASRSKASMKSTFP